MEAYLNELSYYPLALSRQDAKNRSYDLADLLKKAQKYQFNVVRCHERGIADILLCKDYTLADLCNENLRGTREMLLITMIRPPFFKEDTKEEAEYVMNDFKIDMPNDILPDGKFGETDCYGLAAAFIYQSISINLKSHVFWHLHKTFRITRKEPSGKTLSCNVVSVSCPEDFEGDTFINWQVATLPRNFVDCGIPVSKKKCNLSSNHHGNDELKEFAKQSLFILPYISEIVTSLGYSPHCSTFVKGFQWASKRIEVVLHWTENSYGMVLQTTARTDIELRQIADELEKKFGNKNS